jgi:ppGpp synthetase/RelA/SpoT-type nucleotidyltranferase
MSQFSKDRDVFISKFETWISSEKEEINSSKVKKITNSLEAKIYEIIKKHAENHDLCGKNVSGKVLYFTSSSRVKSPASLKEKLLRSDFGLKVAPLLQVKENLIEAEFDSFIKTNLDDLIGIRIITWFNKDVLNIFEIFKTYKAEFENEKIFFLNLENQPQEMKNGLDIYRIEGTYESYPFELQIKSRLEDAWAELEHTQFYKNPIYTRERDVYKNVLISNYSILKKIDESLCFIREGSSHEGLVEQNNNRERILNFFNGNIKKKLDFDFDLVKFYPFLQLQKEFVEKKDTFEISPDNTLLLNPNLHFLKERKEKWDLVLYESFSMYYTGNKEYVTFVSSLVNAFEAMKTQKENIQISFPLINFLNFYLNNYWTIGNVKKKEFTLEGLSFLDVLYDFVFNAFLGMKLETEKFSTWDHQITELFNHSLLIDIFVNFEVFNDQIEKSREKLKDILNKGDDSLDEFFTAEGGWITYFEKRIER